MQPYQERFLKGTRVRIADRSVLEEFSRTWRLHHPITSEQISHAGIEATVKDVGFYHGGDVLYELENIPGTWHESCLADVASRTA